MAPMRHPAGTKKGKDLAKERRKSPRFYFKLPVSYARTASKDHYGGIVGNASEGGILIHLPEKLDAGEVLKIEILFAKEWELKTVRGVGKVVWSDLSIRKSGKVHRYGLQFQLFNKRNLQKLRILLKEASKKE
jgi:hypothetical protein